MKNLIQNIANKEKLMREEIKEKNKNLNLANCFLAWTYTNTLFPLIHRLLLISSHYITVIVRAWEDKNKTAQKLKSFKNTKRKAQRKWAVVVLACFLRSVRKKLNNIFIYSSGIINELMRGRRGGENGDDGFPIKSQILFIYGKAKRGGRESGLLPLHSLSSSTLAQYPLQCARTLYYIFLLILAIPTVPNSCSSHAFCPVSFWKFILLSSSVFQICWKKIKMHFFFIEM